MATLGSYRKTGEKKYFNIITDDITQIEVTVDSYFECVLKNITDGTIYDGFILAKSLKGNAITVCEISFQKSNKDGKYYPRLTFKRTDTNFVEKKVAGQSITQRISFKAGEDGYKEFWKMIHFLKVFKDLVDTGDFHNEYSVVKDDDMVKYFRVKEKAGDYEIYLKIIDDLGIPSTLAFHSISRIKLLKSYKDKIEEFIDRKVSETQVQNWIDEDNHIHRQDRCMIFGLEFVSHKREAGASGDRYDILTRIGFENEERVLIELKSPSHDIFDVKESETTNNNKSTYSISSSLSRAIPQILEYRKTLEDKPAGDAELEKVGENGQVKIAKCIIVIGTNIENARWKKNLRELRRTLAGNLEIWTYTDLLHKLDAVIANLEKNIKQ